MIGPRDALCECGCGRPTKVPKYTHKPSGQVAGVPLRFVHGHNGRGSRRAPDRLDYIRARYQIAASGCWEWTGNKDRAGYGMASWQRRTWRAHRFVWTALRGPIPDGLYACHHCDNPSCVNPDHIFLGTALDNFNDSKVKGRRPKPASQKGHQVAA